jgi:AcrR family transcriptional regulator
MSSSRDNAGESEETTASPVSRRGGRPSRDEALLIRERILDAAEGLFLTQGYGATSIEMVAQVVRMSKRTFYHRFQDKAALFEAVVHRIIGRLRPADISGIFLQGSLEDVLLRVAQLALRAALTPEATALQRLLLAEAARFPELARIALGEGSRQSGVRGLTALLMREKPDVAKNDAEFAAEQFLQMVLSLPQRRALGMGLPMSEAECQAWTRDTVRLFLHGFLGQA